MDKFCGPKPGVRVQRRPFQKGRVLNHQLGSLSRAGSCLVWRWTQLSGPGLQAVVSGRAPPYVPPPCLLSLIDRRDLCSLTPCCPRPSGGRPACGPKPDASIVEATHEPGSVLATCWPVTLRTHLPPFTPAGPPPFPEESRTAQGCLSLFVFISTLRGFPLVSVPWLCPLLPRPGSHGRGPGFPQLVSGRVNRREARAPEARTTPSLCPAVPCVSEAVD